MASSSKCLFFFFDQLPLQFAINIHLGLVPMVLTAKGTQTVHSPVGKDCCFDLPQCRAPSRRFQNWPTQTPKLTTPPINKQKWHMDEEIL